jgi:hypothetical protein
MKSTTISRVEIEIGDNLYLRIDNVSFLPARPGYISGRPEDCYEDEPAVAEWKDEDCKLVIKKKVCSNFGNIFKDGKVQFEDKEYDFECDPSLAAEYYEQIIETIEEGEK